ncbi:MAG: aldehyde dehydrogenase family protein, partial [Eubacteriales bacterium]|nr:aldehyde dehydrogenase family protein [Eubacteriales bacterium]
MERRMYINGNWQEAQSGKKLTLTSPTDSSIIAVVTKGDVEDARLAITAAKIAFQPGSVWRKTSEEQRSKLFLRTAELMEERIELFANAESECNGRHLRETRNDAMSAAGLFRYYAGILGQVTGSTFNMSDGITSMTMLEPVGVVGGITPWNYPLMIACGIIAPALAAGNTVVLKPASNTPLTSILLFEVLDAVGFPEGVVNLVLGGGDVGEEIVRSFDVDMVMFIGGTETGRRIMQAASNNVKRVALELGGKSPVIVFDDCNLEATVDHVLMGIFLSSGQVCTAGSRIIVQEEIYDEFVNRVAERASKIRVGRYDDVSAQIGPLASEAHLKNVMAYIETGIDEGARLVTGGKQFKTEALANGYFLEPTVFADVRNSMKIA